MTVEVWAWWPNEAPSVLADWASIGVSRFILPKVLSATDVTNMRPYTLITRYDPSTAGSPNIVANWIPPDEPDSAAGSRLLPVPPATYTATAAATPHPTFGSMGRSWVDLNYNGRGAADAGQEEPLRQYAAAVDEMQFFVYPMTCVEGRTNAAIYRQIDCPTIGIERMTRLAPGKPIGFCMEAGNIYGVRAPTYDEMLHEATTAVDTARRLGHQRFRLVFFNQRTVGGFDQSDGLHNPETRRAMTDLCALYARP